MLGKTRLPELEGLIMKAPQKELVWQFLDSKFDSILVWDSE